MSIRKTLNLVSFLAEPRILQKSELFLNIFAFIDIGILFCYLHIALGFGFDNDEVNEMPIP